MRIIQGSTFDLVSPQFVDADEETPAACETPPSCSMTTTGGVVHDLDVVDGDDVGRYTAAVTVDQTELLDVLDVVWTGETDAGVQVHRSQLEVVGAHYVSVYELRQLDGLDDKVTYPTALLKDVRARYEETVESVLPRSYVPRFHVETFKTTGRSRMMLAKTHPRSLREITVDGVTALPSDFDLLAYGGIEGPFGFDQVVRVGYEYGLNAPPPHLRREVVSAMYLEILASVTALAGGIESETLEGRTLSHSRPDPAKGKPTGVVALDAVLVDLGIRPGGVR